MLKDFMEHLAAQVNRGIYVWGAQGQEATEDWICSHETGAHRRAALKLYQKRLSAGNHPILAFDCSGLGMAWLYNATRTFPTDLSAHGMRGKCLLLTKDELLAGDWVFKVNGAGRAYHIGYVCDAELNVIESRGRAWGVVKRPLAAGGWNAYGRPRCFLSEIEAGAAEWRVKRTLKRGCGGADVRGLQQRLIAAGFPLLRYGADGDFGSETERAVTAYKRANGLTADGAKAGWATATLVRRLGGKWKTDL